jgi:hypothetical protein
MAAGERRVQDFTRAARVRVAGWVNPERGVHLSSGWWGRHAGLTLGEGLKEGLLFCKKEAKNFCALGGWHG